MKSLERKLYDLQNDTNKVTGFSKKMCNGFDNCIAHARRLEAQILKLKTIKTK